MTGVLNEQTNIRRNRLIDEIKTGQITKAVLPDIAFAFEEERQALYFAKTRNNMRSDMAHATMKHSIQTDDMKILAVLRNVGVPMGHMVIAIQSTLKGLRKLLLNEAAINGDLDNCWAVVAEAIQTILRREAYPHPYEALKALTRTNQAITEESIKNFIETLEVSEEVKKELRAITPHSYTGI